LVCFSLLPDSETASVVTDVEAALVLIKKGVSTHEERHVSRVVRALPRTRKHITVDALAAVINKHLPATGPFRCSQFFVCNTFGAKRRPRAAKQELLGFLGTAPVQSEGDEALVPEAALFLRLLVVVHLLDLHSNAVSAADSMVAHVHASHHCAANEVWILFLLIFLLFTQANLLFFPTADCGQVLLLLRPGLRAAERREQRAAGAVQRIAGGDAAQRQRDAGNAHQRAPSRACQ
jgi:hypothetical protein